MILIDKPNETFKKSQKFERNTQMKASKTQKHLKEISYPQKKAFKNKILHQQKQMLQFHKILQNA